MNNNLIGILLEAGIVFEINTSTEIKTKAAYDKFVITKGTRPTWNSLKVQLDALAATEKTSISKNGRVEAYPSIGDQLDALYKLHHLKDPAPYAAICLKIEQIKAANPIV